MYGVGWGRNHDRSIDQPRCPKPVRSQLQYQVVIGHWQTVATSSRDVSTPVLVLHYLVLVPFFVKRICSSMIIMNKFLYTMLFSMIFHLVLRASGEVVSVTPDVLDLNRHVSCGTAAFRFFSTGTQYVVLVLTVVGWSIVHMSIYK